MRWGGTEWPGFSWGRAPSGARRSLLAPRGPDSAWRLSLLQRPLLVLVGAMVTTGGVFGTLWPTEGTRTGPGPRGPLLGVLTGELWLVAGDDTGEDSLLIEDAARGSSACLASLRRAAAKPECADCAAGLPLATMEPLRGDGVRGLTVAVVLVAVESIPNDGDFGSWLMPQISMVYSSV